MKSTRISSFTLTQAVKAYAHRLGFQLVGVTTPEPPPHVTTFEAWLSAGRHGEMAYLESERSRQRRADPRQILAECRSILVLGIHYPRATFPSLARGERLAGKIAAYAWGLDYHEVLPARLRKLVDFIASQVGYPIPNRWYTDTGPLLERDLAQRAGLGWIGKNTCLIHPRQGSYFLLAEILLGVALEPDEPFTADHCGSCRRCLEVCPTGCILPDRTLDARRCISYLTIEIKGAIPTELRPAIGDWVFGCDQCQQVCPWNVRFTSPDYEPAFAPIPDHSLPDLIEALSLTHAAFNQRFKETPIRRAKRRGYLRNAAVALGNLVSGSGDETATQALARSLLNDPEPLVRGHVAWALGRVGGLPARQALDAATRTELDSAVRAEIQEALASDSFGANPANRNPCRLS